METGALEKPVVMFFFSKANKNYNLKKQNAKELFFVYYLFFSQKLQDFFFQCSGRYGIHPMKFWS